MFKLFAKYAKDYKLEIVLAPIFKIFEAVFGLITPLIVKNIIDKGINGDGGVNYVLIQGLILLILAIVGFLMTMVCQYFSIKVATNYAYILRNELYKKINSFSYREIDKFTPSKLETNLSNDLIATQNALMMMLRLAIRAPFIVIGALILSIFIAPSMAWIFLVGGVLLGLISGLAPQYAFITPLLLVLFYIFTLISNFYSYKKDNTLSFNEEGLFVTPSVIKRSYIFSFSILILIIILYALTYVEGIDLNTDLVIDSYFILAVIPLIFYGGGIGKNSKIIQGAFYLYYPLSLCIIYLVVLLSTII